MKRKIVLKCGIKLSYRLTKKRDNYIITCTEINGKEKTIESVAFACTRKRVKHILNILAENDVFPCHLKEIIAELMC